MGEPGESCFGVKRVPEKTVRIVVATHKEYPMPEDPMYLPVQVGRAISPKLPYAGDDTGPNISAKNQSFCELTGLYWAWKNLDCEYIGLCHYRRHFGERAFPLIPAQQRILRTEKAIACLGSAPILLPRKRNYFIETNYSQYVHAHHAEDLEETRRILQERYTEYLPAYDACMKKTTGHRFNMFIMRRDLLDEYCAWLFDILFELERRLDISSYTPYDRRVFGFVAERLLDVWIERNCCSYTELPVVNLESQHWIKKGTLFLLRKIVVSANCKIRLDL